jgi:hypothetical protein
MKKFIIALAATTLILAGLSFVFAGPGGNSSGYTVPRGTSNMAYISVRQFCPELGTVYIDGRKMEAQERNNHAVKAVRPGTHRIKVVYDSGRPTEYRRFTVGATETAFATVVCDGNWDVEKGQSDDERD